jgi:hypothetical protein
MELSTPKMKTRWSLGDLQNYCKESTRSFNMAMQWPTILEILTSNDQKGLCLPHEPTSREATRRIQIMRGHLKAVQRRRLTGGLGGEALTAPPKQASNNSETSCRLTHR